MATWHWLLVIATALVSAGFTLVVRQFVQVTKLGLAEPRERDVHKVAIPRLGGVAVSMAFIFVSLLLYVLQPGLLAFIPETILGIDKNLLGILAGVILLSVVGAFDDIYGLSPWVKLAFHIVAGVILAASTVLISHITNPFGGAIVLGWWTYPLVVAWVVFMINVLNFLDGLDGLAVGTSLIATVILYLVAVNPTVNQASMAVLALILTGALAGFLPFNFYPAKIFLGDSGSQVLGFLLAAFAIISGAKLATAFLVLGVPILDVFWVVGRRILTKQPIYKADRYHIHHRLLRAGLSQKQAVLLLYAVSAVFGMVALQTQSLGKLYAALILIGVMILGGAILVAVSSIKEKAK